MTFNEAQGYVKGSKWVIDQQGNKLASITLSLSPRQKFRISMIDANANVFVLDVYHSGQVGVKMSFHLRDTNSEGLVRLDYNGYHANPVPYTDDVPEVFKPYEGEIFDAKSHLHLYVEGYGLDWALPIEDTEIDPKTINATDPTQGFKDAFSGFCKYLNLKSEVVLDIR